MQIVSNGDNLHELRILFSEKKKNVSVCRLLKIIPTVLRFNEVSGNLKVLYCALDMSLKIKYVFYLYVLFMTRRYLGYKPRNKKVHSGI